MVFRRRGARRHHRERVVASRVREITTAVDVGGQLELKRAAMAAHASQIPETTSAFQLGLEQFAAVYGWEWFVRSGPPGPIDELVP